MKLKLYEILNAVEVLKKVMNSAVSLKTAYRLSKVAKKCNEELALVQETQKKLVAKYGDKNEKGEVLTDAKGNVTVSEEAAKEYKTELAEFLNTEVEIDVDQVVIKADEKIEISAAELMVVENIIKIEE